MKASLDLPLLSLVPKLHLGTQPCLGSFASRDAEAQVRHRAKRSFENSFRSQVQLGNEDRVLKTARLSLALPPAKACQRIWGS